MTTELKIKLDSQYETGLLGKKNEFEYEDSYSNAPNRLQNVKTKLETNPKKDDWYQRKTRIFEEGLCKQIITRIFPILLLKANEIA